MFFMASLHLRFWCSPDNTTRDISNFLMEIFGCQVNDGVTGVKTFLNLMDCVYLQRRVERSQLLCDRILSCRRQHNHNRRLIIHGRMRYQ